MNKGYVYRFLDKGNDIIYIGRTKNIKDRIREHNHLPRECYDSINKIEYVEFDSKDESAIYERYLINKHSPIYNTEFNNGSTFTFELPEVKWVKYEKDKKIKSKSIKEKTFRIPYFMMNKLNYNNFLRDLFSFKLNKKLILEDNRQYYPNIINEYKSKFKLGFDYNNRAFLYKSKDVEYRIYCDKDVCLVFNIHNVYVIINNNYYFMININENTKLILSELVAKYSSVNYAEVYNDSIHILDLYNYILELNKGDDITCQQV